MNINGMEIRESPFALEDTKQPMRVHKRRKWMRASYHARIQKKWTKRFGTIKEPCIFKVSPSACGLFGPDYFIAHPAMMQRIREAMQEQKRKFGQRYEAICEWVCHDHRRHAGPQPRAGIR